jgi:hypothetical protein
VKLFAAVAAAILTVSTVTSAHDVPDDVLLQAFLRPEAGRVRLLVRVPLAAMRDVDVPTRERGELDLSRVDGALRHAATIWLLQGITLLADGAPTGPGALIAVRASLPSDRAFESYPSALAAVTGPPLDAATRLFWEQGALDALIDYPVPPTAARFSIRTEAVRLGLRTTVALRLITPQGAVRAFEWHGDPGIVNLDPGWSQAAASFLWSGIGHVFSGPDHLLFLLCIAVTVRRLKTLAVVVTSFTVAHATTLVAAAYGLAPDALWFPPLVEVLIAVSIVWMALENIVAASSGAADEPSGRALRRRWAVTTAFGLVHGFGFSFALQERLQFAGAHLLTSLLAFNAGVEIAQLIVIGLAALAVTLAFRYVVEPRLGTIVLSAIAAHTGWHWMTERADVLRQFPWPTVTASFLITTSVWLAITAVAAALAWAARGLLDLRDRRQAGAYRPEATESVR